MTKKTESGKAAWLSVLQQTAIALGIFLVVTFIFLYPLLQGKALIQSDMVNFKGMAKAILDFREKYHEDPFWTASMFSGMPAYQILIDYRGVSIIRTVNDMLGLWLPNPANLIFLYMLGFYILLAVLKVDPMVRIFGALAFAFSSYFFIIVEVGHITKANAIAYIAPVLAGTILAFRGKYLIGLALSSLFLALEIFTNHLQITYYLFMFLGIYVAVEFFFVLKEKKTFFPFIKACTTMLAALAIAIGCNCTILLDTYQYSKYTTRGKSELTINPDGTRNNTDKTSGLDRSYATAWSYGISETMTLLIPNFKGGASQAIATENEKLLRKVDGNYAQSVGNMSQYFGDMPFTAGPVYAGAIVCLLFVAGLFLIKDSIKWTLLIGTIISIVLAWGRHFDMVTNLLLDYLPFYNKFRTVSMILVLAEFTLPLLATLVLDRIIKNPGMLKEQMKLPFVKNYVAKEKALFIAFALSGGIALLCFLSPSTFTSFTSEGEYERTIYQAQSGNPNVPEQQVRAYVDNVFAALASVREAIVRSDAGRSFIFSLLSLALIFLFIKKKIEYKILVPTLTLLIVIDMGLVNKRYLSKEDFVPKNQVDEPFPMSEANHVIMQDPDPNFRVFNTMNRLDQDAATAYYHKSLGGYHGAKLKRYQELIDFHLNKRNMSVINMLNTKYLIVPGENNQPQAMKNPDAMGSVWFVEEIKLVQNADSEITAMNHFNPRTTVIADKHFESQVKNYHTPLPDSSASIREVSYKLNHIKYRSHSAADRIAVFSEIYYSDDWNAYIDGKPAPYFRANYVLRAMKVPAGDHTIEFKIEPKTFRLRENISWACNISVLLLLASAFYYNKKTNKSEV